MEDKPKTKREIIDPVNVFVQKQKPLIIDLKNSLKGQIHEIAENIKAKYTKPRKPMSEETKAKLKARREAVKKAKVKPETAEMGVGTEPEPEPKKTETKEDIIKKVENSDYTYNELAKLGARIGVPSTAVKGKKPTKSELEKRILQKLKI
jgi:hypothetical protein